MEFLTRQKVAQYLGANSIDLFVRLEERRHPWSVNSSQELNGPLLRIWDEMSGSQPSYKGRMLSRWPDQPLDTEQARKNSLATHLNHRIWEPTPYISFTTSASAIEDLAAWRSPRRGNQTLTVINPATRFRAGLPILDVATEMIHYDISDPYNRGNRYYTNHYVCLWEVTGAEVINHYDWNDLIENENWYEEVIMPAFDGFNGNQRPDSDAVHASAFDMLTMMENLPIADASISPSINSVEDSDGDFEHELLDHDSSSDSDTED